jgi:hypothetical protein
MTLNFLNVGHFVESDFCYFLRYRYLWYSKWNLFQRRAYDSFIIFRGGTLSIFPFQLPKNIRQYSFYSFYVAYASSCVYPFLYITYNKGFRFAINQILGCKQRHVPRDNPSNTDIEGRPPLSHSLLPWGSRLERSPEPLLVVRGTKWGRKLKSHITTGVI